MEDHRCLTVELAIPRASLWATTAPFLARAGRDVSTGARGQVIGLCRFSQPLERILRDADATRRAVRTAADWISKQGIR